MSFVPSWLQPGASGPALPSDDVFVVAFQRQKLVHGIDRVVRAALAENDPVSRPDFVWAIAVFADDVVAIAGRTDERIVATLVGRTLADQVRPVVLADDVFGLGQQEVLRHAAVADDETFRADRLHAHDFG